MQTVRPQANKKLQQLIVSGKLCLLDRATDETIVCLFWYPVTVYQADLDQNNSDRIHLRAPCHPTLKARFGDGLLNETVQQSSSNDILVAPLLISAELCYSEKNLSKK